MSSKFEIRKSIGGWSVDKLEHGQWMFMAKFSSKKSAAAYINTKTEPLSPNTNQLTLV